MEAGVKHIVLAVSYRAEMLEHEMNEEAKRVSRRLEVSIIISRNIWMSKWEFYLLFNSQTYIVTGPQYRHILGVKPTHDDSLPH